MVLDVLSALLVSDLLDDLFERVHFVLLLEGLQVGALEEISQRDLLEEDVCVDDQSDLVWFSRFRLDTDGGGLDLAKLWVSGKYLERVLELVLKLLH